MLIKLPVSSIILHPNNSVDFVVNKRISNGQLAKIMELDKRFNNPTILEFDDDAVYTTRHKPKLKDIKFSDSKAGTTVRLGDEIVDTIVQRPNGLWQSTKWPEYKGNLLITVKKQVRAKIAKAKAKPKPKPTNSTGTP